jgi:hypothetical protein
VSDSPGRPGGDRDFRVGPRKVVPGKIAINPVTEEIGTDRRVTVLAYDDPQNAKRERVVVRLEGDVGAGQVDLPANDWCTLLDYMMEFLWGRDVEEALDAESTGEETTQAEDERPRAGPDGP